MHEPAAREDPCGLIKVKEQVLRLDCARREADDRYPVIKKRKGATEHRPTRLSDLDGSDDISSLVAA
jgi:hypothetical protein